jgi:hypothetical protein
VLGHRIVGSRGRSIRMSKGPMWATSATRGTTVGTARSGWSQRKSDLQTNSVRGNRDGHAFDAERLRRDRPLTRPEPNSTVRRRSSGPSTHRMGGRCWSLRRGQRTSPSATRIDASGSRDALAEALLPEAIYHDMDAIWRKYHCARPWRPLRPSPWRRNRPVRPLLAATRQEHCGPLPLMPVNRALT